MHTTLLVSAKAVEGLAVMLLGLMAGFFFAFWVDVAPALARLDASGYVTAQQHINAAVRNAWFGAVYFGAAPMPWVVAGLYAAASGARRALPWALIALVYGAAVFWLTRSINVPINDLVATWNPAQPPASWSALRDRWNEANAWRALAAALCFGAALWVMARAMVRQTLRPSSG